MAKTKQTPENRKIILDCASRGMSDQDCFTVAGISKNCFYQWIKGDSDFNDAIQRARIKGKYELLDRVYRSASSDPKHAEWLLSHKWPDEYSEKRITEIRKEDKSPHELILEALESAEMEESSEDT